MVSCALSILLLRTRQPSAKYASAKIDLKCLKEPVFLTTTISVVMAEAGLIIPVIYLTSFALSHGINTSLSYQVMSIFSATSIVGRIITGVIADWIGRFNVMIFTAGVCAISSFTLWLISEDNRAAILSFVALFGFWSGPAISLSPVCVAQVCQTTNYGKRYGTVSFLVGITLLVIIPVAGAVLRSQNSTKPETNYSGLICLCGFAYAISSISAFLAKGLKIGWRPTIVF
jgi:MFS family permease